MNQPPPYNGNQAYYWNYAQTSEHCWKERIEPHQKVPHPKVLEQKKQIRSKSSGYLLNQLNEFLGKNTHLIPSEEKVEKMDQL